MGGEGAMSLTPLDIHNKEFKRGFRGYSEAEVDEFLDQVVKSFEGVMKENGSLKEQLQTMTAKLEHYRHLEETLHNTLIVAQETADEVKASARKEAELIVREAQLEADRLIKQGEGRIRELRETIEQLHKEAQVFRARIRSMLEGQLELLDAHFGLERLNQPEPSIDQNHGGQHPTTQDEEPVEAGTFPVSL